MAPLKQKGDLAELKVAADLAERGCSISFPFGEDCDYDLIADLDGQIHRIQVKYTESDGRIINVRCRSHSLTNGKIRRTKQYTAETVDWIASTTEPQITATTFPPQSWARGGACSTFAWFPPAMANA
jgi:hypothetical protein